MRKPCYGKQDTSKGARSKQEDMKLMAYLRTPQAAGLVRCSKSCRLRWISHPRSEIKPRSFTEDEEDLIIKLHALLGKRWSLIAGRLPGRAEDEVKNYWNSHLSQKLIRMGVDPNKHRLSQNIVLDRPQSYKHKDERRCSSPDQVDDDQDSDAASRPEDSNICMSPELNLDLTLSVHSLRPTWQNEESMESMGHEKPGTTACRLQILPLFR